jgi:hypothetical protein
MVIEDGIVYDESLQELDLYGHEQAMLAERQAAEALALQQLQQTLTSSSDQSISLGASMSFVGGGGGGSGTPSPLDGTGSSISLMYNKDGNLRSTSIGDDLDDLDDAASFISSESSDDGSEDDEEKKIRKQILWAVGGMVSTGSGVCFVVAIALKAGCNNRPWNEFDFNRLLSAKRSYAQVA